MTVIDLRDKFDARREAVRSKRFDDRDFCKVDAAVARLIKRLIVDHGTENIARSLMSRAQVLFEDVEIQKTL